MGSKSRRKTSEADSGNPAPGGQEKVTAGTGQGGFFGGFTLANLLDWGKTLLIAGGLALVIRWSIGEPYKIPSGSMEPTLHGNPGFMQGDRVWVNKWHYGWRWPFNNSRIPFTSFEIDYAKDRIFRGAAPERFDIVVFKSIEDDARHGTLVKRIIGLPGEHVHIAKGGVYINGERLELPESMVEAGIEYESPERLPSHLRFGIIETDEYSLVPEGHYLVLGDNSKVSRDGRVWGWVPNEHLLGPVTCVWWPPQHWRDFTGFSTTWWWRGLVSLIILLSVWRMFVGRSAKVPKVVPDPALRKGDHLLVHRLPFGLPVPGVRKRLTKGRCPKRGELVLYRTGAEQAGEEVLLLGRAAAFPGERVSFEDDHLQVDGEAVDAPGLDGRAFPAVPNAANYGRGGGAKMTKVPDAHVFILSETDEPNEDGRTLGWTPETDLVGVVKAVWWPPFRWKQIRP